MKCMQNIPLHNNSTGIQIIFDMHLINKIALW